MEWRKGGRDGVPAGILPRRVAGENNGSCHADDSSGPTWRGQGRIDRTQDAKKALERRLKPGIGGLALQRPHAENTFVSKPQWFLVDKAVLRLDPKGELPTTSLPIPLFSGDN